MSPVSVVTDSTSYLPPDLIERNRIDVVPLYVVFGGDRTVPEVDITDYPAFFEELRSAEKLPTTSQPSVGDFTAVFEPLLADGGEVVSVHISGGLSGTPEAARQAKEALTRDGRGGERIEVVDSTTAAGGLGFMVLAAAKAARDGGSAQEVAEHVAAARRELRLWFAIDTLEFLKRGGRIGAASAWIGSTLKVKPILTVENEMTPVERVRTSSRAFERLVENVVNSSAVERLAAETVNSPGMERVLIRVIESRLVDALVHQLLDSDELWLLVSEIARSEPVTDAITADSLGFAGELAAEMRAYSRGGDDRVERIARRMLRRGGR